MRLWRILKLRLRSLARRRQVDQDLQDELRDHLERQRDFYLQKGLSLAEARAAAARDFGSAALVQDRCLDERRTNLVDDVGRDVRYAFRTLRRSPGYAIVSTASLALTIGAMAAIFSLLNALVLRELPVKEPGQLVHVSMTTAVQGESALTLPLLRELSSRQRVFSAIVGTWGNPVLSVIDDGRVMKASLWATTSNLFDELGVRPALGRALVSTDMTIQPLSGEPVAVLGHGFWQRQYQSDVAVIGRTIYIEGAPFTVVGVAPAGFTGFSIVSEPDITIPLGAVSFVNRRAGAGLRAGESRSVKLVGRLKAGVTLTQAEAQLTAVWPEARAASIPAGYTGDRLDEFLSLGLKVASAANGQETALRARYTSPLVILLAIAGLVLLIACTNVAGLLLSRASVRRHEIDLRLALGATRFRVARQLMTEGLLVSTAGAVAGVVLAYWACAEIAALVFADFVIPVVFDGRPDLRVVAVTTAIGAGAGVLCGALPAWRGTRRKASDALRTEGRTSTAAGRIGPLVMGGQVALSVVLLATTGVLVRTLVELRRLDTGIERSEAVLVAYPEAAQPGAYDGIDNDAYYPQVLGRIESLPGVERASVSLLKPGAGDAFRDTVVRSGAPAREGVAATRSPVAPGFFSTVGIRLVKGRDFDWGDRSRTGGVTVLSESLARQLFTGADPIGQRVRIGLDASREALEVIGVVSDARVYDLKTDNTFAAYTAALQDPAASFKCFVIRGNGISSADIVQAVTGLGRERVGNVVTLRSITDQSLLRERLAAMMSGFFGFVVLLLAGVGLYGLLSQTVTQRRKEIGIRMAVGADSLRVVWEILRRGLAVTIAGIGAGVLLALPLVGAVKALLFGVSPQDPLTMATAVGALVTVAVVACIVPAVRAARVDPITVLRSD